MAQHNPPPPPRQAPPPPPPPPPSRAAIDKARQIKIVQHSQLFYWWPVWLMGFILGIISFFSGERLAVVDQGSRITYIPAEKIDKLASDSALDTARKELFPPQQDSKAAQKQTGAYVIVSHEKDHAEAASPFLYKAEQQQNDPTNPKAPFSLHIAENKNLGIVWAITLILVVFITNVPLRGMWSVVVLVSVVLLSIIFILAGVWETIINWFHFLDIRINTGGYFFISLALFAFWTVTVFLFDQQTYWMFSPGQLRIHEAIGGGEKAFDTRGMVTEKHRDDLFRHWILGLGTGDLTVRTSGAEAREFRIQNVWWVGHKLSRIQEMQREHAMVGGGR